MDNDHIVDATKARDRLCKLMDWTPSTSHKFEIMRKTMTYQALALSVEKAHEIADRLEFLEKQVCDLSLALRSSEFLEEFGE